MSALFSVKKRGSDACIAVYTWLVAMQNVQKFAYIVDKRPNSAGSLILKTEVNISPKRQLSIDPADEILVFSFGYMVEIHKETSVMRYKPEQFHLFIDLFAGGY